MRKLLFLILCITPLFLMGQTLNDKVNNEEYNLNFELKSSSTPKPYDATYDVFEFKTGLIETLLKEKPKSFILTFPKFAVRFIKRDLHESTFVVNTTTKNNANQINHVNYEGVIEDSNNSTASLYISEKGVSGMILDKDFNKVYTIEDFISVSHDTALKLQDISNQKIELSCDTEDKPFPKKQGKLKTSKLGLDDACVKVYLEVDYDIFVDKGRTTQGVLDYINGIMSQVKLLYTNENVNITISEIFIWDTPSPYNCSNSGECLNQFWQNRPNFNGDIGHLLSYQASGGIAYLDALCHPAQQARRAFSSIGGSYNNYPTYSWTVMVVAHEIGHNLGSRHTHACVWNGNNTAIDGCAGGTEGTCPNPGLPQGGGTIMSYCHLQPVGINFTKGFGPQPANVIRNFIASANCVTSCDDDGGDADTNLVKVVIRFDDFPTETGWEILDENNVVVAKIDSYNKDYIGQITTENVYLPNGNYTFKIKDSYGDGICCEYGNGVTNLIANEDEVISIINSFEYNSSVDFTLPYQEIECAEIVFEDFEILSYAGGQDRGYYELNSGENTLSIFNNAWKKIDYPYTVTEDTWVEFEFKSDVQGQIHGIAFDNNNNLSSTYTFRVWGTQSWGIPFETDKYIQGQWIKYKINVGQYYTGDFLYFCFVADNDQSPFTSESSYRNLKIYEKGDCN